MSRVEVNRFACKLRLIRYGLLKEVNDIDEMFSTARAGGRKRDEEEDSDEDDAENIQDRRNNFVRKVIKLSGKSRKRGEWTVEKSEAVADARRVVVKEFMSAITANRKCANCQG